MNEDVFKERVHTILEEESHQPPGWWYLSYATEAGFVGGVIVEARGFTSAVMLVNLLSIRPGPGQVMGLPLPPEKVPPDSYRYRPLTVADIKEFWPNAASLGEIEGER